jgi:hypothetical protein
MTRALGGDTNKFTETSSVTILHSTGRPTGSDEDVDRAGPPFIWSPKMSISRASAELQISQTTVHSVLRKNPHLKSYKLQVV